MFLYCTRVVCNVTDALCASPRGRQDTVFQMCLTGEDFSPYCSFLLLEELVCLFVLFLF